MKQRSISPSDRKRNQITIVLGSAFLILLGIVIGAALRDKGHTSEIPSEVSAAAIYDSAVLDIASNFLCACGSCGDTELATCTCPTAKKEKDFIKELVKKSYDKETIIKTVDTMFGKNKSS